MKLTIVAITSVDLPGHIWAINRTFAEYAPTMSARKQGEDHPEARRLLLSDTPPPSPFDPWKTGIGWSRIPRMGTRAEYSRFVTHKLADYIETNFALIVQADGYAIDGRNWSPEFFEYDYIGAPIAGWFAGTVRSVVGNGGFSLRSKRWLQVGRTAPANWGEPEDWFACVKHRAHWEAAGCRIAPLEVAMRFACEHRVPEFPFWQDRQSFGIHGNTPKTP